nr:VRR-NUC domain-containing protein [Shewanella submarina]
MSLLIRDENVAWVHRCNTGKALVNGRAVEFGLGKGTADIIGQMKGGKFLAVEIKTPKGKVSEAQRLWLNRVAMHGGLAAVVRSTEDMRNALKHHHTGVFGI